MAVKLEAGGFTLPLVVLFPKALLALCLEQPLEGVEINLPQRRQHLQTQISDMQRMATSVCRHRAAARATANRWPEVRHCNMVLNAAEGF